MKRTMYEAARHTPKRGVGGSNPLWDAKPEQYFFCSGFFFSRKAFSRLDARAIQARLLFSSILLEKQKGD